MDIAAASAATLRAQIAETERSLAALKAQLAQIEDSTSSDNEAGATGEAPRVWPLSQEEYTRYGRQMIVPSVGIQGQLRLHDASVLIVGAGGLGCPAAAYIAGSGVRRLGLVDGDTVEISNLHRQILHNTHTVNEYKVDSAIQTLAKLNPNVTYIPHRTHLTPQNARDIVSKYDVVLDCTDHPKSRYLISDICVLLQKPLISASALKTEGQLTILNSPAKPPGTMSGGPCYRCVFPKPPPADQVTSCANGGILGPVVGVMGVLQALECIKLIVAGIGRHDTIEDETGLLSNEQERSEPTLLIFSALSPRPFRSVRLRSRRADCFACSSVAGLSIESLESGSLDYVAFCGEVGKVNILKPEERISAADYSILRQKRQRHILIDVREKIQFDICNLEGSMNVPFSRIQGGEEFDDVEKAIARLNHGSDEVTVFVVCRLGNDSQVSTRKLAECAGSKDGTRRVFKDIEGGLKAWKRDVDEHWPEY